MRERSFQRFIGVNLGGGRGKNTAVAVARRTGDGLLVERYDTGDGHPWFDDRLVPFLLAQSADTVLAIDAPLTLTACVRCAAASCPGMATCDDAAIAWMRRRSESCSTGRGRRGVKPVYTPYTQRLTEILLHEDHGILPREALGQGMGPLTARAAYLARALASRFRLHENLIEVSPKATIHQLLDEKTARMYKRNPAQATVRLAKILNRLPELTFAPGQWRERGIQNDHLFDAVIAAYTAFLWTRDDWQLPAADRATFLHDGWIWIPPDR